MEGAEARVCRGAGTSLQGRFQDYFSLDCGLGSLMDGSIVGFQTRYFGGLLSGTDLKSQERSLGM